MVYLEGLLKRDGLRHHRYRVGLALPLSFVFKGLTLFNKYAILVSSRKELLQMTNGYIIESVRTLAGICADEMQTEKDRLSAAETLANIPGIFSEEIMLVKKEVNSVRNFLMDIQQDTMTTARGKVKAAQILIRVETLILSKGK